MARKKIGKILSGSAIVLSVVLFCTVDVGAQITGEPIKYTISGSAGISGVTMKGLTDAAGQPVVTDASGYYSVTVNYGWKGTVTPDKEGYTFSPQNKTYPKVTADMPNEDYVPAEITFTISGKAGMEGVEMNGLPGNPITGANGTYSATVPFGWQSMVTPMKQGYEFKPSNRGYPPVKSNQTNQDYAAETLKVTIAGSVGVEGTVLEGLPGNPATGPNGNYIIKVEYGWSGTVTPKKEGYQFNPAFTDYPNVLEPQSSQDYTATALTYVISGTAGMDGVEMKGLPGNPMTDLNGYYSVTVNHGFSATVEPTKPGYTFMPASKIYTKVNSDRTSEDYSATVVKLTVSGTTRMEGVQMNGLPENPVTAKDGSYSVKVDYGWSGTVTPMKEGYTFKPESKTYPQVTRDMTTEVYSAERIKFTISGSAGGVPGVAMRGFPGSAVMTGPDGTYSVTVDHGWSGTVTPVKDGYDFSPASLPFDNILGPQTNQNFTPTIKKIALSGRITSTKGEPVAGVYVLAEPGGAGVTTDATGNYRLDLDYGWRGKITPTKEGYTFNPPGRVLSPVTKDQTNQVFAGTVQMFTISDEVVFGNVPIEGVTITAAPDGGTTATDAKGKFSIQVPYGWSGDITPKKEGINFNPPSQHFDNVTTNIVKGQPQLPTQPATVTPPTVTAPPAVTVPPTTAPAPTQPIVTVPPTMAPPPTQPTVAVPPTTAPPLATPLTPVEQAIVDMQRQLEAMQRGAGTPGAAGRTPAGEMLITNRFVDMDLVLDVLPVLAEQAGISIIPDETVQGLITADLKGVPLDTALEIVLAGTPYVVKKTPYYYLVCSAGVTATKFPVVSETRRLKMNYITSDAAVGLLSIAFKPYVQAEIGPAGIPTYTVVVTAPPALMTRIIEDLRLIDKMPAQVLLDARIVVMERGDLLNLGVEWSWPSMKAGLWGSNNYAGGDPSNEFNGKWPWGVQMGYSPDNTFTNALELTLNLLAENGEATILAKPQVLAQDGKQAQIRVTTEENFAMIAPEVGGTGGVFYSRSEFKTIESGTTLTITPHVGDSNDITLQMAVEVSDSIPRGRGSELPVVTRRTAENNVTVQDGGTVALAGLTENRTRKADRRVPGFSSLPLIGDLFKSSDKDNSTREIAVFVTARIIPKNRQTFEFPEQPAPMQQAPTSPAQPEDIRQSLRESLSRRQLR